MTLKRNLYLWTFLFLVPFRAFATGGTESTGTSVKDSSDTTASANKTGQILSYLTAGVLATESAQHFAACSSHNKGQCVLGALKAGMAALSMAQAAAHGSTAGGATTSSDATDGSSYSVTDTASTDASVYGTDGTYTEASAGIAKLESCVSGSYLNTKTGTITTADGKTYKVSDFASTSAMANAGIPSGAIAGVGDYEKALATKVLEKMEKLKIGALSATAGIDEGGGGASDKSAVTVEDPAAKALASKQSLADVKKEAVDLAGLSKNYNGEPIGVSAQNIFVMVTRRYKLKESQDAFNP